MCLEIVLSAYMFPKLKKEVKGKKAKLITSSFKQTKMNAACDIIPLCFKPNTFAMKQTEYFSEHLSHPMMIKTSRGKDGNHI